MRPSCHLLLLLLCWLMAPAVVAAPSQRTEHVEAALLSEVQALQPAQRSWLGLRLRLQPGWHIYWRNPGDSGLAPTLEWHLPAGLRAGDIRWPLPERIPAGPLMSYGYQDEVLLLVPLVAATELGAAQTAKLAVHASWLVCQEDCIPEEVALDLGLPVSAEPAATNPDRTAEFAAARAALPVAAQWQASVTQAGSTLTLRVPAPELVEPRPVQATFLPYDYGTVANAAPQQASFDATGLRLRLQAGDLGLAGHDTLDGILVVRTGGAEVPPQGFELHAQNSTPPAAGIRASGLILAIGLAWLGGLLLNLMPCVLPVISLKILGLARHGGDPAAVRHHALAFTAGVLTTFTLLALVLLGLRAAGEQVGWGFQLQSPVVVALLAYLMFGLGLSLSGVYGLGTGLMGLGEGRTQREGASGSFFTGALAVVVASPCTAPFMGAAVGVALTRPWPEALAVLEGLGLGMATPYLLLALRPAWLRILPRPGPWMERLKELLAFPLYASAVWLVWVAARQSGPDAVLAVLAGLLLLGLAAWLVRNARRLPLRLLAGLVVATAVALALGLEPATSAHPLREAGDAQVAEPYSGNALDKLRAAGVPVFVNVTADWCITCLVNERVALSSPEVMRAFRANGVRYLKGDWTRRSPELTALLARFGRAGVPLYVLYPVGASDGEAIVLPQILTAGTVVDAVNRI